MTDIDSRVYTKVKVDECPDANGHWTIRFDDGTPNGDTDQQPIATVYSKANADTIAAAINSPKLACFMEGAMAKVTF